MAIEGTSTWSQIIGCGRWFLARAIMSEGLMGIMGWTWVSGCLVMKKKNKADQLSRGRRYSRGVLRAQVNNQTRGNQAKKHGELFSSHLSTMEEGVWGRFLHAMMGVWIQCSLQEMGYVAVDEFEQDLCRIWVGMHFLFAVEVNIFIEKIIKLGVIIRIIAKPIM